MLAEATRYLESKRATDASFSYEIIVVSDGSRDRTVEVAQRYGRKLGSSDRLRVIALEQNRGKGGAVRLVSALWFLSLVFTMFIRRQHKLYLLSFEI